MAIFLVYLIFGIHFAEAGIAAALDECLPTRCGDSGPIIRFPFWLKGQQPEHCGYPGFELSCSSSNTTEFEFQYPVRALANNIAIPLGIKVAIYSIDYEAQLFRITDLNTTSCFPKKLPDVNLSVSPFDVVDFGSDFTFFNCSSFKNDSSFSFLINCLSKPGQRVYAMSSEYTVSTLPNSCYKMYNISNVPNEIFQKQDEFTRGIPYHWSAPSCRHCEAKGKYCWLKSSGTRNETECYDIPKQPGHGAWKKLVAGVVVGVFLLVLILLAVCRFLSLKIRQKQFENKIELFLEDYKALRPTRYSYADVKKITDQFKEKLGQGGYGTVYKGKLSNDIVVAAKVLNNFKGNGEEFINEVATIGRIHHVNVVRLIGYCADGYRRALVYEFLPYSLEKLISAGNQGRSLGWEKLHQIALGIAKGIDYLHQGCNQRILHFDIKPHNILLDQNFNPKVAAFGLAKLCSKEQSIVSMTAAHGTMGYIAPEMFSRNYGSVSYKSDVYSFGMLLLDSVGGRKNVHVGVQDSSEVYFPEWMYNQLEKGEEIAIEIEKEEDNRIFKKLTIVGLWCVQWFPADRPSMKVVIQMLEAEHTPILPPNPFAAMKSMRTDTTSKILSNSELETISE